LTKAGLGIIEHTAKWHVSLNQAHLIRRRFKALSSSLIFVFVLVAPVLAQEALRTAVAEDNAYRTRNAAETRPADNLRAGPVNFAASMNYDLEWNDNVYLDPSGLESDFIQRPRADLHATWPATKDSQLTFGMGLGYEFYLDHSDLNRLLITPDSELAWDINWQDSVFTVYDNFQYSQDVISQGGLSGTAEYPRIENTAGLRNRWFPDRYIFELGFSHYNFIAQSSTYDYQNRSSEQMYGRAAYRVAEATHAGVESSGSLTYYESDSNRDNQSISVGPFVEWQVTRTLQVTARGGYVTYLSTSTNELSSYYLGLKARHQLTDHYSHGLSVDREVRQGVNEGSEYNELLTIRYFGNWAFHRNLTLGGNFFYEHSKEPQYGVSEKYDRYGATTTLTWRMSKHFSTSLIYRFTDKNSNLADNDYQQNVITLSGRYQF